MISKIKKVGGDILFGCVEAKNIHDMIALLKDGEADVNALDINGRTPLFFAVEARNTGMIKTLLEYGALPNVQENENVGKNTAMHLATGMNQLEVVDIFFAFGADGTI